MPPWWVSTRSRERHRRDVATAVPGRTRDPAPEASGTCERAVRLAETQHRTRGAPAIPTVMMTTPSHLLAFVAALLERLDGRRPAELRVERHPLHGGLEAAGVDRLDAYHRNDDGAERVCSLVVKRLTGSATREASLYEHFVAPQVGELSPRLLAVERPTPNEALLYIEAIRPASAWPWRDQRVTQAVLDQAARLHARAPSPAAWAALTAWDYEAELEQCAASTLESLHAVRRHPTLWSFGGALRWTRRVVAALPALRRQLLVLCPFGRAVVHGDLHSGNVVLRQREERTEPVLLDWGRARIGSPLEDVSSWLQSLGAWEPEARRRHDTLFVGYLAARGLEPRLSPELRAAYWLAGASNALSGALMYHLSVLLDGGLSHATRASAAYSARQWLRVVRRADAFWR